MKNNSAEEVLLRQKEYRRRYYQKHKAEELQKMVERNWKRRSENVLYEFRNWASILKEMEANGEYMYAGEMVYESEADVFDLERYVVHYAKKYMKAGVEIPIEIIKNKIIELYMR